MCLMTDARFSEWVETYAHDSARFLADFGAAWAKLQELGCAEQLAPHPQSLNYASSCYLPTEWLELPLRTRRALSADASIYSFGLPPAQKLNLPVCACVLMRAPGIAAPRRVMGTEGGAART